MRIFLSALIFWVFWLGVGVPGHAAQSEKIDTGKVKAQFITGRQQAAPGETFYVALRTEIDPHWHTYWLNPGDSGEPVQISWELPAGMSAGDIIWPLPAPIPTGPIINYGFDGAPVFPVPLTLSPGITKGEALTIKADIYYLVCKDICIPEQTELSFDLMAGESQIDARWDGVIEKAVAAAPKAGNVKGGIVRQGDDAVLFSFIDLPEGDFSESYFFPFAQDVVDHSAAQNPQRSGDALVIETRRGYGWDDGARPQNADGLLRFKQGGVWTGQLVSTALGEALAAAPPAASLPNTNPAASTPATNAPSAPPTIGFFSALIGAFLGGLLLNLMPCVFPVISLKALKLAKTGRGDEGQIKREALAYLAGVLVCFAVLTVILLSARTAAAQSGWGFHLQNPVMIAALILLFFVIGLNLLGAFEFTPRWAGAGQALSEKPGPAGSFFTGILAAIVATPCTAPFMAGAIGYALTQSPPVVMAVFLSLGLGFALPFILIAFVPALRQRLPKPGPWMARFRQALAFPIFATVIWLIWVLVMQAGDSVLVPILLALLGLGFAIWLFKSERKPVKILGVVVLLAALAVPPSLRGAGSAVALTEISQSAWSPGQVEQMRAQGRAVFVDFTAAWCVTCKVNEKLVLDTKETKALFANTNTAFLIADWTNKNDMIAAELTRHGRSGIPLYLLYPPGTDPAAPEILPQILSYSMLEEKLTSISSR